MKLRQKAEMEELQRIHQQQTEPFSKLFSYATTSHFDSNNCENNHISIDNKDFSITGVPENPSNYDDLSLTFSKKMFIEKKMSINTKAEITKPPNSMDERMRANNSEKTHLSSSDASPSIFQNSNGNFANLNICPIIIPFLKDDKSIKDKNSMIIQSENNFKENIFKDIENMKIKEKQTIQEIKTPEFFLNSVYTKGNSPKRQKLELDNSQILKEVDSTQDLEITNLKNEIVNIPSCKSSKDFACLSLQHEIKSNEAINESFSNETKEKRTEGNVNNIKKKVKITSLPMNNKDDKIEKSFQSLKSKKEKNSEELEIIYKKIEVFNYFLIF